MTGDQLPVPDPAVLFRRQSRRPDDCRRCGQPTITGQLAGTIVGRTCPSCGYPWTYPAPVEVTDVELDADPDRRKEQQ